MGWFGFQETALEMIRTIREAFNELLAENHWMDNETRAVAKSKADSMNERIGYPEFLKDPVELSKEYVMVLNLFINMHRRRNGISNETDDISFYTYDLFLIFHIAVEHYRESFPWECTGCAEIWRLS